MAIVIPAFFGVGATFSDSAGNTRDSWEAITNAGKSVRMVVADYSFPDLAPDAVQRARGRFDACRGKGQMILGYVHTRGEVDPTSGKQPQLPKKDVEKDIEKWYTQYGQNIDGIFFDEGPLWSDNEERQKAFYTALLKDFKSNHPDRNRVMLNAAQF